MWAQYLIIALPALIGYSSSAFCKIGKNAGEDVPIRPPSVVFGVMWPILYLLLGISWLVAWKGVEGNKKHLILVHVFYSLLTLLLAAWIVVYGCGKNKKGAIYVILASIAAGIMAYTAAQDTVSKILIVPLLVWLLFALLLNCFEVNNKR